MKIRTQEQTQIRVATLIMTLLEGEEVLGEDFIAKIERLELPALYYHKGQHDNKRRTIILQCIECILGCLYNCDSLLFCEKLTQIPSPAVRECIDMNRLMSINKYHKHDIMDEILKQYTQYIDFFPKFEKESIYQIHSWITLKSQNQDSNSPVMKKFQQPPPKDAPFLTEYMSRTRFGDAYHGFDDAVPTNPSATVIDTAANQFVSLDVGNSLNLRNGPNQPTLDIMETISEKNPHFDLYMRPEQEALADRSRCLLEKAIVGPNTDTNTTTPTGACMMVQTQTNNFAALCRYHPEYIDETFDLNNKLEMGRSIFLTCWNSSQRFVVHPAHYLIFSPGMYKCSYFHQQHQFFIKLYSLFLFFSSFIFILCLQVLN